MEVSCRYHVLKEYICYYQTGDYEDSILVKPPGKSLDIYIETIVEKPHLICMNYLPWTQNITPLHDIHFMGTFISRTTSIMVEEAMLTLVMMSHVLIRTLKLE